MDAVGIAEDALLSEVKRFKDGTAEFEAVNRAATHVIITALAAGKELGLHEANRSAPAPAQDTRPNLPNAVPVPGQDARQDPAPVPAQGGRQVLPIAAPVPAQGVRQVLPNGGPVPAQGGRQVLPNAAVVPAQGAHQVQPNAAARTNGVYSFVEALGILLIYFIFSTTYCVKHFQNYNNKYKGTPRWDMVYFVVVTTLTIGYGDIYPATRGAKINTILLVLLGGILVSHLGDIVIETCKSWLKKRFFPTMIGRKKEAMVYLFSFMAAVLCIVIGMVGIFLTEHKNRRDPDMTVFYAFYLSVMSLATVGYGDFNFQLVPGRKFAVFWLLVCQPIFRESSKFVMAGCFRQWNSIVELHLKILGHSVIIFLPFIVVPLLLMVFLI